MRKVVLIVTAVAIAAIAAQAQSAGAEVRMADTSLRGAFVEKPVNKGQMDQRKVQRQLLAALERQVAQRVTNKQPTAQTGKPSAVRSQPRKPAVAPSTQKITKKNAKQWIKAIFFGSPFPGESEEAYRSRLVAQSQPAALPFK